MKQDSRKKVPMHQLLTASASLHFERKRSKRLSFVPGVEAHLFVPLLFAGLLSPSHECSLLHLLGQLVSFRKRGFSNITKQGVGKQQLDLPRLELSRPKEVPMGPM